MHVLIIGADGQLGVDLCAVYGDMRVSRADLDGNEHRLDLRDAAAMAALLAELHPDLVINTAAYHQLEDCESHLEEAFEVNAAGAMRLARACAAAKVRLVHLSTNYVFGQPVGDRCSRPYLETDLPAPINVLGASKLAGEHLVAAHCPNHLIVRTAALYGAATCRSRGGRNFVENMLHMAGARQPMPIKVIGDIVTTPTYAGALAAQVRLLAEKGEPGLYHATCNGACSWFEFAAAIFEETGMTPMLVQVRTADFQTPVRRPSYSVLDNAHARRQGLDIMPHWRDALRDYLHLTDRL